MKHLFRSVCALFVLSIFALFFCNFLMFVFFEPFLTIDRGVRFVIGLLTVGFFVGVVGE